MRCFRACLRPPCPWLTFGNLGAYCFVIYAVPGCEAVQGKCIQCGGQEFHVASDEVYRLGIPGWDSLVMQETEYACVACGEVGQWNTRFHDLGNRLPPISLRSPTIHDTVAYKYVMRSSFSDRRLLSVDYQAAFRTGENVLLPTFEGRVQDATVVDRYGKPDLMTDFAEEYLRQFEVLMPVDRLPGTLMQVMPALLLLVVAAELSMKAFLIRRGTLLKGNHSLDALYKELDDEHRIEVERRFSRLELNLALVQLGQDPPAVESILQAYSQTYGEGSSVYTDARYYAEPTTMFPASSHFHNANLSKGNTPYPIFLPSLVRILTNTYRHYSGAERLRRLGGDIQSDFHDSGNDNHGEWGIMPSSLGLVVVSVPQFMGMDAQGPAREQYQNFRTLHPTDFSTDWMYGGNTLLFYRDIGQRLLDGKQEIDGLACRIWRAERLGLHSRDLDLLADALERAEGGEDSFGHLV